MNQSNWVVQWAVVRIWLTKTSYQSPHSKIYEIGLKLNTWRSTSMTHLTLCPVPIGTATMQASLSRSPAISSSLAIIVAPDGKIHLNTRVGTKLAIYWINVRLLGGLRHGAIWVRCCSRLRVLSVGYIFRRMEGALTCSVANALISSAGIVTDHITITSIKDRTIVESETSSFSWLISPSSSSASSEWRSGSQSCFPGRWPCSTGWLLWLLRALCAGSESFCQS